jgi:hypothetical protein
MWTLQNMSTGVARRVDEHVDGLKRYITNVPASKFARRVGRPDRKEQRPVGLLGGVDWVKSTWQGTLLVPAAGGDARRLQRGAGGVGVGELHLATGAGLLDLPDRMVGDLGGALLERGRLRGGWFVDGKQRCHEQRCRQGQQDRQPSVTHGLPFALAAAVAGS